MARFNRTTRLRTARFSTIGQSVTGTVISVIDASAPEFEGSRIVGPKFDINGTLVTQPDITLKMEDGSETLIHAGVGIEIAIAQALQTIGADDLHEGDTLTVTYTADEDTDSDFPVKVYTAVVAAKPAKSKG